MITTWSPRCQNYWLSTACKKWIWKITGVCACISRRMRYYDTTASLRENTIAMTVLLQTWCRHAKWGQEARGFGRYKPILLRSTCAPVSVSVEMRLRPLARSLLLQNDMCPWNQMAMPTFYDIYVSYAWKNLLGGTKKWQVSTILLPQEFERSEWQHCKESLQSMVYMITTMFLCQTRWHGDHKMYSLIWASNTMVRPRDLHLYTTITYYLAIMTRGLRSRRREANDMAEEH